MRLSGQIGRLFQDKSLRLRSTVRVAIAVVALCSQLLSVTQVKAAKKRPPNIVLIMADDLGYGDLGCYNRESKIPTPNLNRLATESIRFTDAHTPSAVCTPTRYGLLTGRYCWRSRLKHGVLWGYSRCLIDPKRMTIASMLKRHGYGTGCIGKWHLGLGNQEKTDYSRPLHPGPVDLGFDYFFGIPASLDMPPYVYIENDRPVAPPSETIKGSRQRRAGGGGFWRGGAIAPGFRHIDVLPTVTKKAVGFIETQAAQHPERPFFLYFPLTAPHTPWMPTKKFRGRSGAGPYGDFVVEVDAMIGRVLKTLDRLKLRKNTLLFVTSDNGAHWTPTDIRKYGHRANGPLRGQKADIWDGGHRVPFLVRWPGKIKPGSVCDETVCLTDVLATCAAVVGQTLPDNAAEDSYNILPALLREKRTGPIRPAIVHHSLSGKFAIRIGSWKLIPSRGSGGFSKPRDYKPKPGEPKGQLYNLAKDLGETENLYQERPDVIRRLLAPLERFKSEGHSRPLTGHKATP